MRFAAKNVALICCFAPVYAVLSFWYLFPIIGVAGKYITMAVIMAPLIGIALGPLFSAAAVALGGIVGSSIVQTGPFGIVSFVPGAAAALCSGLLYNGKRWVSTLLYSVLLLVFTFYPVVGPAWLHPHFVWLQLAGLALLVSPLQLKATEFVKKRANLFELSLGVGIVSFISTLFSHIVGSIMFEILYWPVVFSEPDFWRLLWQTLTFVYPLERIIVTIIATIIGVPLFRALMAYGFEIGGETRATFRNTDQAD